MKQSILKINVVLFIMSVMVVAGQAPLINECLPSTGMIVADDTHTHYEWNIGPLSYHYVYGYHSQYRGRYGSFEVTAGSDITFFIVDQDNFEDYEAGLAYSRYCSLEDVLDGSFEFRIPTAGTWYFVFCNKDALITTQTVSFDLYGDYTPPTINMNLDAGATYSGIKEITATITEATFDIGTVRLRIDGNLKDTEYDSAFSYSWDTTQYSNGAHTIRISASDTVENIDYEEITVYVSNAVPGTTNTGAATTGGETGTDGQANQALTLNMPLLLGLGGLVVIIGIAVAVSRRGKEGPVSDEEIIPRPPPPKEPEAVEPTSTREKIITERFLVICPFCGTKNQQGITKCQSCGAKL